MSSYAQSIFIYGFTSFSSPFFFFLLNLLDYLFQDKTCEYFARWEYDENLDKINFTIISNNPNKWTGIGQYTTHQQLEIFYSKIYAELWTLSVDLDIHIEHLILRKISLISWFAYPYFLCYLIGQTQKSFVFDWLFFSALNGNKYRIND